MFTDHSLFGFASPADIHLNKIMKFSLADIDHVICVSNIGRENLVLRALIPPDRVGCAHARRACPCCLCVLPLTQDG